MSELWSELILPEELTGYARQAQADYEQSLGTLARWLPNRPVQDIVARFFVGRTGLLPVASFRAYDAETPIGQLQGLKRVTIELPPIGQKNRIGEYDQIRQRGGDMSQTVVLNSVLTETRQLVRAVSDRMEYERGKAIEFGTLNIQDNGIIQTGDWGRSASHSVTADWSDADAAILDSFNTWVTQYRVDMGVNPGTALTSTRVIATLARSNDFRHIAANLAGVPGIVTRGQINQVLDSYDMPQLIPYDRLINYGGTTQRVLSDNKVYFLPPAVADVDDWEGTQLGASFWGRTLESDEPDYNIEPAEAPGIVAATWKTRDPIGVWVHTNAIGLVAMANADLSMVATVLPDSS